MVLTSMYRPNPSFSLHERLRIAAERQQIALPEDYPEYDRRVVGTDDAKKGSTPFVPAVADKVQEKATVKEPVKLTVPTPTGGIISLMDDERYLEYLRVAETVGIPVKGSAVEAFKQFLKAKDWPVYNEAAVVAYMDAKCAAESDPKAKRGWRWFPLRDVDNIPTEFGDSGMEWSGRHDDALRARPASNYYASARSNWVENYPHTLPLHALNKIATIESELGKGTVAFVVNDYAPAPQFRPDPFLMAIVVAPKREDYGPENRFIIDFWDEPGFGFDLQLK